MSFTFREEDHSYWLSDRRLDGVTETLGGAGMIDSRFFTEEARTRGQHVHRATEYIDKGSLDWTALDPVLVPYCEAYRKFIEDTRPEIILSEKASYHPQHLYAGRLDRILKIRDKLAIVDFSTGDPLPAKYVQVAAYWQLALVNEKISAPCGHTLWLRNDATYRLSPPIGVTEMRRNFNIFLAALAICRWKKEAA